MIHPKLVDAMDAWVAKQNSAATAPRGDTVIRVGPTLARPNLATAPEPPHQQRPFYEGLPRYRRNSRK